MLCAAMPTQSSATVIQMPRRISFGTRLSLPALSHVSGVDVPTIQRWQLRRAMKVRALGRGKVRSYDLEDALHVAIIAEMSRLGLSITGTGADLSSALASYVRVHVRANGTLDGLGSIALEPEGDDWLMQPNWSTVDTNRSFVAIGLGILARGVVHRLDTLKSV